jgi:hypothetical protein
MGLEASPPDYGNLTLLGTAQDISSLSPFQPQLEITPEPQPGPSKSKSKTKPKPKPKSKPSKPKSSKASGKRKRVELSDEEEEDAKSSDEEETSEGYEADGKCDDDEDELDELPEEPIPQTSMVTRKRKAAAGAALEDKEMATSKKKGKEQVTTREKGGKKGKEQVTLKEKGGKKAKGNDARKEKAKERKELEGEGKKDNQLRPRPQTTRIITLPKTPSKTSVREGIADGEGDIDFAVLPIPSNATPEIRELRDLVLRLPATLAEGKDGDAIATSFYTETTWGADLSGPDSWEHWDRELNTHLQKSGSESQETYVDKLVKCGPKGTEALYRVLAHVMENVIDPVMLDGKIMRIVQAIYEK